MAEERRGHRRVNADHGEKDEAHRPYARLSLDGVEVTPRHLARLVKAARALLDRCPQDWDEFLELEAAIRGPDVQPELPKLPRSHELGEAR